MPALTSMVGMRARPRIPRSSPAGGAVAGPVGTSIPCRRSPRYIPSSTVREGERSGTCPLDELEHLGHVAGAKDFAHDPSADRAIEPDVDHLHAADRADGTQPSGGGSSSPTSTAAPSGPSDFARSTHASPFPPGARAAKGAIRGWISRRAARGALRESRVRARQRRPDRVVEDALVGIEGPRVGGFVLVHGPRCVTSGTAIFGATPPPRLAIPIFLIEWVIIVNPRICDDLSSSRRAGPDPGLVGVELPEALRNAVDLAQQAERFGYERYWFAEHHLNRGVVGAVPSVAIALVAGATRGSAWALRASRSAIAPPSPLSRSSG